MPDAARELILEREGDARARARLAAAAAAGAPLIGPDGRERSPITLREYRLDRAPANKGKRYPAEVLTFAEITALLDAFPARTPFGARQRALVVVLWRAGLRIAEALALLPKDIDLERGAITILCGKGAKRRVVGIDPHALLYLREWIAARAALAIGDSAPVFCTISRDRAGVGRPLHSSTVRESLKSYAKRAGITKRVHPHAFRHSYASDMANEGIATNVIRQQLGHEDLRMTQHYLDHLAPQDVLRAMRARAWPGGSPPTEITRVATSQGAPAPRLGVRIPDSGALPLDRPLAGARPEQRGRAATGETKTEMMGLVRANGGRATTRQLSRALRLTPETVDRHCRDLAGTGQLVRSGLAAQPRGAATKVWAIPALKATYELQPHTRIGTTARRGHGPERALEALSSAGGRASTAQVAGLLGITPTTVAKHFQLLEARGQVERGGLDKRTSNRGSQVWALPGRHRWMTGGKTLRVPSSSSSTRPGRT